MSELFDRMCSLEEIYAAYRRARRGLKDKSEAILFEDRLEHSMSQLQADLRAGTYRFGPYRLMIVRDPKERSIHVAPFRDRIVHQMLHRHMEAKLERSFIADSYACRKGKGNQRALRRLQSWLDDDPEAYVLMIDVAKYFGSIDRSILLKQIKRHRFDPDIYTLIERLIHDAPHALYHGCGLPIGNLTSQILANLYLNEIDHFAKDFLGVRRYIRYVDDIVCLGTKAEVHVLRRQLRQYLEEKLKLQVAPHKEKILSQKNGINYLGFILRSRCQPRLRRAAIQRFYWSIRRARSKKLSEPDIAAKVLSWCAHAHSAPIKFILQKAGVQHYIEGDMSPTN